MKSKNDDELRAAMRDLGGAIEDVNRLFRGPVSAKARRMFDRLRAALGDDGEDPPVAA